MWRVLPSIKSFTTGTRILDHISESLETIFGDKIQIYWCRCGSGWKKFASRINAPDPHHCILVILKIFRIWICSPDPNTQHSQNQGLDYCRSSNESTDMICPSRDSSHCFSKNLLSLNYTSTFPHKGVERTEILLPKIKFLRLKIMCLRVSYKK